MLQPSLVLRAANDDVAGFAGAGAITSAISGLTALEGDAIALETTQSGAQEARDTFFDSGAGVSFADSGAIGDQVAHLEAAQTNAADLEDAAENAQGDLAAFFSGLNSDSP